MSKPDPACLIAQADKMGFSTSYCLFEHGTLVFLPENPSNIEDAALFKIRTYGAADFGHNDTSVARVNIGGWFVASYRPDIMVYLLPDAENSDIPSDYRADIIRTGRAYKQADAARPVIIMARKYEV